MLPNLVIIGALKCGTTSLHYYLDQHPEIAMSRLKELHFFSGEDWQERIEWYRDQFQPGTRIRGETTPHYTWYPHKRGVPQRMHSLIPDTQIIYLVRDPLERILSHYVQYIAQGGPRQSFAEYMKDYDDPANVLVSASLYATQIEKFLEFFPLSQILVVDQHDLKVKRQDALGEIFRFLGVDDAFYSPAFQRELNTRAEKYALTRVGDPLWNRVLGPAVRRLPKPVQRPIMTPTIRMLSRKIRVVPAFAPDLRRKVVTLLQPEVARLRQLTGREFATWSL